MARKAATKAAAAPLDGCSIATSGKFAAGITQSALAARVASLGATVATKVRIHSGHTELTTDEVEGLGRYQLSDLN